MSVVRFLPFALVALTGSASEATLSHTLLLAGTQAGPAIVAVGERGTIVRSEDHGATWRPLSTGVAATLTGISFAPGDKLGWAVGHEATIVHSSDGGLSWKRQWQGEDLNDSFLDVLALDAQRVIAVGAYGLFVETRDGGATWSKRQILDSDAHLNRFARGPDATLYLAGESGTLLVSRDQGATWTALPAPYAGSLFGIVAIDPRTLLAAGLRGRIFRSEDSGASWQELPTGLTSIIAAILPARSGAVVLAGSSRLLSVSRDGARSFQAVEAAVTGAVSALLELADGSLLTLGEAGPTRISLPSAP